jgi:uncharacterized membrane protein YjjP (DUF1212 family)
MRNYIKKINIWLSTIIVAVVTGTVSYLLFDGWIAIMSFYIMFIIICMIFVEIHYKDI